MCDNEPTRMRIWYYTLKLVCRLASRTNNKDNVGWCADQKGVRECIAKIGHQRRKRACFSCRTLVRQASAWRWP